jgi:hypothetical protein
MGVLHQQYNIHQRTIHRMPIIAQLWMNLNWVLIFGFTLVTNAVRNRSQI